ncbi:hypothetical protein Hypma_004888 [Hypsizygus marmoreus]|uniref:Uncharacterized protein n=1 Tax=Hypsizygus marmoreus TaxID=39966 RepID=A0A369KGK9_HYPMA|nr:hypothetical protein Hypma_004888 [Hypsizygus marmoreus]
MNSPLGFRLQHLTSTNEEPSSSECFTIRKHYIENGEERLAALNDQIAQAQAAVAQAQAIVDSLTKRAEEEEKVLNQYRCTLAPIRRVPCDILIEIFLFSRDWEHKEDKKNYPKGYGTAGPAPGWNPLLTTHICSARRRIAFSSPILWTTVRAECIFDEQCLGDFSIRIFQGTTDPRSLGRHWNGCVRTCIG